MKAQNIIRNFNNSISIDKGSIVRLRGTDQLMVVDSVNKGEPDDYVMCIWIDSGKEQSKSEPFGISSVELVSEKEYKIWLKRKEALEHAKANNSPYDKIQKVSSVIVFLGSIWLTYEIKDLREDIRNLKVELANSKTGILPHKNIPKEE